MAVDLVNTIDLASGDDELADLAGLRAFLERFELDWHNQDWFTGKPTKADLAATVALRSQLRSVFDAEGEGAAAEVLNEILREVEATPRISVHGSNPHLHFEPAQGRFAKWLGAATAMGLSVVLCEYGFERLGTCASSTCVDAYVDTSRNRSRRHCSTSCTTRENVTAYRERQKAD